MRISDWSSDVCSSDLWFPFLSADRLRISGLSAVQPDTPLALVEKVRGAMRLMAVDQTALALGLAPGLMLADARARVPDLEVADHDSRADQAWLERPIGRAAWRERGCPSV